jgi:hypothetical protein
VLARTAYLGYRSKCSRTACRRLPLQWQPCYAADFQAERQDQYGGLGDLFSDIEEGLVEWIVTAARGEQTVLELAYFDRGRDPAVIDVAGPGFGRNGRRKGLRAGPAGPSDGR